MARERLPGVARRGALRALLAHAGSRSPWHRERLAGARGRLQATLNDESLDLNLYRIAEFDLRRRFAAFFSSCLLGMKKLAPAIFQKVVWILQRDPSECLFIDDRESNLEPARALGMRTLLFEGRPRLEAELRQAGLL